MAKKKTDEATTEPAAEQPEDYTCPNCGYNPKQQAELIATQAGEADTDAEPA